MRRRDFIAGLGAAAWPLSARAQQRDRMRRIGAFMFGAESEQAAQSRRVAFEEALQKLGWIHARNVRIDWRWGSGDVDHIRMLATELVGLRPDVLFAGATPELAALQQASRSIPIVFALTSDPVGLGFVASFARPGGNITGFMSNELSLAGKWLELLKEAAPRTKRVAFLYNPDTAPYAGAYLRYAESAAAVYGVELIAAPVHNDTELEEALAALAREPNGGLVVGGDEFLGLRRQQVASLAIRHRLPAIYGTIPMVEAGGLIVYASDFLDDYRSAAGYVDRILKGEKPANLPVQAPVKYQLVVNLKSARAIGLSISEAFLVRADRVIE